MHVWMYGRKFSVANLYNPPKHELALATKQVTLTHTIIAGDFNAKSPSWGYDSSDSSGQKVHELCNTTNLSPLQTPDSVPTLLHTGNGTLSRPDLTLISLDLDS